MAGYSYFRPRDSLDNEQDRSTNNLTDLQYRSDPASGRMPGMSPSSSSGYTEFQMSPYTPEHEKPGHSAPQSPESTLAARRNVGHGKETSGDTAQTTEGATSHHNYFSKGAHRKNLRKAPLISSPAKGTEDLWLPVDEEATEWLSLFYDLVVVAVLIVLSTKHELSTPTAIPVFLSFFVIIFWTWVAQTAYDMRYQGNDALNRFFKFIQIGLFIYQGAASANWNPGKIQVYGSNTSDPYGARVSLHDAALQSFTTVVVAFVVGRAVLIVQYGICLLQGRKAGRHITHIGVNIAGLLASLVLATVAFCLPASSSAWKVAKIVLFYSGIGVEVINVFAGIVLRVQPPIETHKVAERYGAFTLIVLGEGIISVTKSFSRSISGLSDDDSATYVQVFLTILILFLLYSFLFGNFDKNDHTGHDRAVIWQMIHFPLCFGLLLLISSMVNVVAVVSSTHGLTLVLDLLTPYGFAVAGLGSSYLDPTYLAKASRYMNKLSLEPPFAQTMTGIYEYLNDTTPALDPQIVFIQYAAQIGYSAYQLYGVDIPIEATNMYYELYGLNTTWLADPTERAHLRTEAGNMFTEIIQDILNDAFTGVLWLLPVAGCVLVLIAIRSMLWYRFIGPAHWIYHGSQLVAGVCLGLLGLLDIGPRHLNIAKLSDEGDASVNPLYRILFKEIPIVIIAMMYLVVYVGSGAAIWILQRRQEKREKAAADKGVPMGEQEKAGRGNMGVEVDAENYPMAERR